jgi:hypothetical protein
MNATRIKAVALFATSIALASPYGCRSDEGLEEGESAEAVDELRALRADEILGDLAFGETSAAIEYTDTPLYRAYRIRANAGDTIDVRVRSEDGGDPTAWLLASNYRTLKSNRDAAPGVRDARIVHRVSTAGTYFIAFREQNQEDTILRVELAPRASGDAGVDGSTDGANDAGADAASETAVDAQSVVRSIWDDRYLSEGTPLTREAAVARFAPGGTQADVGTFVVAQRSRACNTATGCGAWAYASDVTFAYMSWSLWFPGPGWSAQKSCHQFETSSYGEVTGRARFVVGQGGRIELQLEGQATGTFGCGDVTAATGSCATMKSTNAKPSGGKSCQLPNPAGGGFDPTVHPTSVSLFDSSETSGTALAFRPRMTATFAHARSLSKSKVATNGSFREVEYALYASLDGSPLPTTAATGERCIPKSCSELGANCGTVSDGCGGSLSCGGCETPYFCGPKNTCVLPEGCNLQPCYAPATVQYTCCGSGTRTCSNGRGCTCYNSCG